MGISTTHSVPEASPLLSKATSRHKSLPSPRDSDSRATPNFHSQGGIWPQMSPNVKTRWHFASVYFQGERLFRCVILKDEGLKLSMFKSKKQFLKHSTENKWKPMFFSNMKLPFAFSSITWTVINSSSCAKNKRRTRTQLNVCVLHAHCYRGRVQTSICDCQTNGCIALDMLCWTTVTPFNNLANW